MSLLIQNDPFRKVTEVKSHINIIIYAENGMSLYPQVSKELYELNKCIRRKWEILVLLEHKLIENTKHGTGSLVIHVI